MKTPALTREMIEARERSSLAPYAALSSESRGRVFPQDQHPLRTAFQRDRDRIIHAAAFRRMEYKTQVFIPHEKDHYRTRLTHTIEVAQIARTMARNLRLNEDLTEAIALVHDLGHTPFGHAGEDVLDELLKDRGGFNHNRQSLRVVDLLEQRYRSHPGLNLSYEVREGIVKHETSVQIEHPEFPKGEQPTLEAALVDISDEIAYNCHDIDDGLSSGIIVLDDLTGTGFFGTLGIDEKSSAQDSTLTRHDLVRRLVDRMASDVIAETETRLEQNRISSLDEVRKCPVKICGYSDPMTGTVDELKKFLREKLYRADHLVSLTDWASEIIRALFARFIADPGSLPTRYQQMLDSESAEVVAADYIAGMTDRYATERYDSL